MAAHVAQGVAQGMAVGVVQCAAAGVAVGVAAGMAQDMAVAGSGTPGYDTWVAQLGEAYLDWGLLGQGHWVGPAAGPRRHREAWHLAFGRCTACSLLAGTSLMLLPVLSLGRLWT